MLSKVNSPFIYRVGRILEAQAQIVNGIMYHVTVELGQTDCQKSMMHIPEACHTFVATQKCHARILSQAWEHKTELTFFECEAAVKVAAPVPEQLTQDCSSNGMYC